MSYSQAHCCAAFAHSVPAYITYCYGIALNKQILYCRPKRTSDGAGSTIFFEVFWGTSIASTNRNLPLYSHDPYNPLLLMRYYISVLPADTVVATAFTAVIQSLGFNVGFIHSAPLTVTLKYFMSSSINELI